MSPPARDSSTTAASCTATVEIYPADLLNEDAGAWKAAGFAVAFNGEDQENPNLDNVGVAVTDKAAAFNLQRYSKLTVNAAPEPVKKGKTVTVTGKLTRANWDDNKYARLHQPAGEAAVPQEGLQHLHHVKTIKSNSTGELKTTTTATVDGYFRYSFAGTTTTPAVSAAGDYVDVNSNNTRRDPRPKGRGELRAQPGPVCSRNATSPPLARALRRAGSRRDPRPKGRGELRAQPGPACSRNATSPPPARAKRRAAPQPKCHFSTPGQAKR